MAMAAKDHQFSSLLPIGNKSLNDVFWQGNRIANVKVRIQTSDADFNVSSKKIVKEASLTE